MHPLVEPGLVQTLETDYYLTVCVALYHLSVDSTKDFKGWGAIWDKASIGDFVLF